MTSGVLLWLAIGGLAAACLAAIGAKVLQDFSRHELEELCHRRRRRELFREVLDHHEKVATGVESLQVAGTVLLLVAGVLWAMGSPDAAPRPTWSVFVATGAVGTALLLVGTVWIPWAIVGFWSAPFLLNTWRIWVVVSRLLTPLSFGAGIVNALMRRLAGRVTEDTDEEEAFEDEIRSMVTEGLHEGLLEADAGEMIESVIEMGDADVAEIMTPRSNVVAMQVDVSWTQLLQFVIECRRTRIPVYKKNLDDIIGLLYVKDLLSELAKDPDEARRPLRELLREAWFVPATKPVDDLLREFLRTRNHLAVVVDEYQAVAGVVTIEDVLEEIVGEIVDEYDPEEIDQIRPINDHVAEALGRAHLDEINDRLGLDLPEEEDFDTVGGLVCHRLGRIPKRGDEVRWNGVLITVLDASRRKVERVRIETVPSSQRETA